ncbi:MAG TPA: hypothetical protein VGG74_22400 [Kofleriaceae bacterium]
MRAVAIALMAACGHPQSPSQSPPVSACERELDDVAHFYEAVADEITASPTPPGVDRAPRTMPLVDAPAADATHVDVVFVARDRRDVVLASGDRVGQIPPGDNPIVVAFDADVPWRDVIATLRSLARPSIALAYRTHGAKLGRIKPVAGASLASVSAATADRCPHFPLDRFTTASPDTADILRGLARSVRTCSCDVDRAQLEALPSLVMPELFAIVPLATTVPAIAAGSGATFGEVVHGNGDKPLASAR